MQRLEVSGAVRPIYGSLGVKRLIIDACRHVSGRQTERHQRKYRTIFTAFHCQCVGRHRSTSHSSL